MQGAAFGIRAPRPLAVMAASTYIMPSMPPPAPPWPPQPQASFFSGMSVTMQSVVSSRPAIDALKLEGDEAVGASIIARAIEAPLRKLVNNAGQEAALVIANVKKATGTNGYNVRTGEYADMLKAGIVDPAKVTRSALQNAASIAGLLLTTDCMVTDIPEKKDSCGCGGHGAPGGMDGMM